MIVFLQIGFAETTSQAWERWMDDWHKTKKCANLFPWGWLSHLKFLLGLFSFKTKFLNYEKQRNLYNKIFGGFLMREAFQLAYSNASLYSKSIPRICVVDNISVNKNFWNFLLFYLCFLKTLNICLVPSSGTDWFASIFELANSVYSR